MLGVSKRQFGAFVVSAVTVSGLAIAGYTLLLRSNDESPLGDTPSLLGDTTTPWVEFIDESEGVSFLFPDVLRRAVLTKEDIESGVLARLVSDDPPLLVTVRIEHDLASVAALARVDVSTLLQQNIDRSLPDRFPGFSLDSSSTVTVSGQESIQRTFTYEGAGGEHAKQRFVAIPLNGDEALYIALQAEESQFEAANNELFSLIIQSITAK